MDFLENTTVLFYADIKRNMLQDISFPHKAMYLGLESAVGQPSRDPKSHRLFKMGQAPSD